MKGLIKKDLYILKSNLKMVIIFLTIFGILAFYGNTALLYLPNFLGIMLLISTFSYDDLSKFDAYALSLPIKRKKVVDAKYLLALILTIVGFIFTLSLLGIFYLINKNINFMEIIPNAIGLAIGGLVVPIFAFPFIYKYGIEKGRVIFYVVFILLITLFSFLSNYFTLNIPTAFIEFFNTYGLYLIGAIVIIIFIISLKLSERFYQKREF